MTGLNNRRGFYMLVEQQLKNIRRTRAHCALIFIDVDGLKEINDAQGHKVGDALITDVASVLKHTFRKSDIIARMGGDEFCVLALNPGHGATVIRERLANEIAGFNRRYKRPYEVSVSVGVVEAPIDKSLSLDRLMSEADVLMYNEKRQRRAAAAGPIKPVR
jgi:diguanylate cyclase (GGDEF)-like protein